MQCSSFCALPIDAITTSPPSAFSSSISMLLKCLIWTNVRSCAGSHHSCPPAHRSMHGWCLERGGDASVTVL